MPGYRIDELAGASGVPVRNIRYYQDRGILPPPRREGRVGVYSGAHLARLRLITRLLDRGYTAANITELITAWERGRDLSEVLGLEQVVTGTLQEEVPTSITDEELRELFGPAGKQVGLVDKVVRSAIVEPAGGGAAAGRYRVPSPRLLHAAAGLVTAGAPVDSALELIGQIRCQLDSAVRDFIVAVADEVLAGHEESWMPATGEVRQLSTLLDRLKPLTSSAASSVLAGSLARHLDDLLGHYVARIMSSVGSEVEAP